MASARCGRRCTVDGVLGLAGLAERNLYSLNTEHGTQLLECCHPAGLQAAARRGGECSLLLLLLLLLQHGRRYHCVEVLGREEVLDRADTEYPAGLSNKPR